MEWLSPWRCTCWSSCCSSCGSCCGRIGSPPRGSPGSSSSSRCRWSAFLPTFFSVRSTSVAVAWPDLREVLEGMPDFPAAVPGDEANFRGERTGTLRASVPRRAVDQRLRARRWQLGAPAGGLQRRDRRDGGGHRRRRASRAPAVLYLAAGQQRLQDRRGAEARSGPRRDTAGPWPTISARAS